MTFIKTYTRHAVGLIMGLISGWLLTTMEVIGYTDPALQVQVLTAFETIITFILMAAVWLITEKALKPVFYRWGERQTGDLVLHQGKRL